VNDPLQFLASHGPMLLAGVSGLLAAGAIAAAAQRSPIHRQRLGEMTIACTLGWLMMACIPLPRWPAADAPGGMTGPKCPAVLQLSANELDLLREISKPAVESSARSQRMGDHPLPQSLTHQNQIVADQKATASSSHVNDLAAGPALASPRVRLDLWLARVYLCGVGACMAWLLLGHVLLARMIRRAAAPEPWLAGLFASVASERSIGRARLRVCQRPVRPLSCGLLRPAVLLGADVAIPANATRLRQVFRHELAHLAQHDAWGNALFNLAFPLLYAHPLYWWLRSRTFLARELIADDLAAATTGRVTYAADLLSLAKGCRAPRPGPLGVVGMFHFTTNLSRRILMLVQRPDALQTRCSRSWRLAWVAACAAAFALACGTLGLRRAAAQVSAQQGEDVKTTDTRTAGADLAIEPTETTAADRDTETAEVPVVKEKDGDLAEAGGPSREALEKKLKAAEEQLQRLRDQLNAVSKDTRDPRNDAEHELKKASDELRNLAIDQDRGVTAEMLAGIRDRDGDLKLGDKQTALAKYGKGTMSLTMSGSELTGVKSMRAGLDLVNLANSYADAIGNIDVARARVSFTAANERAVAEAQVHNAEAKARLLGNIVKIALEQAETELGQARQLADTGAAPRSSLEEAEGRVKILQLILESGQETGGPEMKSEFLHKFKDGQSRP